jgi:glucose-1-phosphate thymidylyltransferase
MIYFPLHAMMEAGIENILVVTGPEHMGHIVNLLGSGRQWNVQFTYRVQDAAGGIAQALGLARDFARDDRMLVILGDNVFDEPLADFVHAFEVQGEGARILLHKVPDPGRYGVPELQGGRVVGIEEKPRIPKSDYCVTGIYAYSPDVFSVIETLKPSSRGELEITDVNNYYIQQGNLAYDLLNGTWTDAGTFESLTVANALAQNLRLHRFEAVSEVEAR